MPRDTGEPTLKDWFPGDGLYRAKLIMVTKGFKVIVSTDWLVLGYYTSGPDVISSLNQNFISVVNGLKDLFLRLLDAD